MLTSEGTGPISGRPPLDWDLQVVVLAPFWPESSGAFFVSEKQIAVPMKHLMVTEDRDTFVLDFSEGQLDNARSFERDEFNKIANEKWRRANDEYFSN
jgi:hypothetical protein